MDLLSELRSVVITLTQFRRSRAGSSKANPTWGHIRSRARMLFSHNEPPSSFQQHMCLQHTSVPSATQDTLNMFTSDEHSTGPGLTAANLPLKDCMPSCTPQLLVKVHSKHPATWPGTCTSSQGPKQDFSSVTPPPQHIRLGQCPCVIGGMTASQKKSRTTRTTLQCELRGGCNMTLQCNAVACLSGPVTMRPPP